MVAQKTQELIDASQGFTKLGLGFVGQALRIDGIAWLVAGRQVAQLTLQPEADQLCECLAEYFAALGR